MSIIEFNKEQIEADIEVVAKSERITKAALSVLSRTLIAYVYETKDIAMATRLLNVLTPVNKRVAALYFPHFLGWSFNEKDCNFGKQLKDKVFGKKYDAACEWLADEDNNIWVYAENEVVLQAKPKNYAAKITQLVTKALKDEEQGIDMKELLFAIMASEEVTLGDLMAPLAEIQDAPLVEAVA